MFHGGRELVEVGHVCDDVVDVRCDARVMVEVEAKVVAILEALSQTAADMATGSGDQDPFPIAHRPLTLSNGAVRQEVTRSSWHREDTLCHLYELAIAV